MRAAWPIFLASVVLLSAGCRREPPPDPAAEHDKKIAVQRANDRHRETIAHGLANAERVFVRQAPDNKSPALGSLRHGTRFDVVESQDDFHRMRDSGWVSATDVRTGTKMPPKAGFLPVPPKRDSPMPYRVGRVTAKKGVSIYRRPPKTKDDEDKFRIRQLQPGYFFTVDKVSNIYGRELYRGTRYWFIPRAGTTTIVAPPFSGFEVTSETEFPMLWVTDPTAVLCPQPTANINECDPVARLTKLTMAGQKMQGGRWYQTDSDQWISALHVAKVAPVEPPRDISKRQRWIHVDIRNQTAALYEGDTMVFVTLASTGAKDHDTPPGSFRVQSKHISATMDDEDNLSSPYFIQDVPWVLFYKGSYAIHGAFWHDRFGLKTSHGCVNLSPTDAKRFFDFASPELPEKFHAVYARPQGSGTRIVITR